MDSKKRVRDVMTSEVKTLRRNDQLTIADEIMQQERVRHLPVLGDDEPSVVGVLSQRDLFRGALARCLGYGDRGQTRVLEQLAVKEVMSGDAVTIGPDATLAEAAQLMVEHRVGCLPVVEKGAIVGIVTETDFLKQFAEA